MSEWYPSDTDLLNLTEDADTGVQYIPTGQTPYYLEFRRLLQRTLLAAGQANAFRPYQDGALSIGVRSGRSWINGTVVAYVGSTANALADDATSEVYIDSSGALVVTTAALPVDRSAYLSIAQVTTVSGAITSFMDRRGEVFFAAPHPVELTPVEYAHAGALGASETGKLAGVIPVDGEVVGVILSIRDNLQTSNSGDNIAATPRVNGVALCTIDPVLLDSDGPGFVSTAQGDGTAAVVKTDSTQEVTAGDIITMDLTRTVSGGVSNEAADVVVMVLLRPTRAG